jgi:hypothetical protein
MLIASLCGLVVASFLGSTAMAADGVDAENLVQATAMVSLDRESVEQDRKYCDSLLPDSKRVIDYSAFAWTLKNDSEFAAVDAQLAATNQDAFLRSRKPFEEKLLSTFKAAISKRGAKDVCGGFASQLQSSDQDIAHRRPAASRSLQMYLAEHPLSQKALDRNNAMTGCQKQAFNKGADFDTWLPICACLADTELAEWSEAERKQVNDGYAAGVPATELKPMQRILPKLQVCKSKNGN